MIGKIALKLREENVIGVVGKKCEFSVEMIVKILGLFRHLGPKTISE